MRSCEPKWLNRDRFILSAGHGSMFIYSWLALSGYDLPVEELSKFRALRSHTPGHPESFETVGVECTTGPLGQGVGNAVGFALSGKMAAAKYNTAEHTIFDNHIIALAGDGCLQEGVAREAVAFAAHNGLDNLILIFDSNDVTLDAMAKVTQSEDFQKMYEAIGWDAVTIDGHDLDAIKSAVETAKATNNGKPKIIIAKTLIGKGIPEVAGTAKAHGEGGAKFIDAARLALGLPADQHFFVSEEVKAYFADLKAKRGAAHAEWTKTFDAWAAANPALKAELDNSVHYDHSAEELLKLIPEYPAESKAATRNSGGEILNHIAKAIPNVITGSATSSVPPRTTSRTVATTQPRTRPAETSGSAFVSTPWVPFATAWPMTASSASAVPPSWCSPTIAAQAFVWPLCPSSPWPTSSRTTPWAWAKTARPTSRWRPSAVCV